MKTKYILSSLLIMGAGLTSCSDFLDTTNLYEKDMNSYYNTEKDITEATAGVYNALFVGGIFSEEHMASELMGDLLLGGGGTDDVEAHEVDAFKHTFVDTYKDLWVGTYNGANRCNTIIEAVSSKEGFTEEFKNKTLGEIYFMRGFLYFTAAKFFGGMPLILTTDADRKAPRATFEETFIQIMSDMNEGVKLLPPMKASEVPASNWGHANKYVAEAMLARVFLYYTGYMTNIEGKATSSVTLLDGTTLDNSTVASYLKDVIDNSGYALVSDFRNLWPYSQVNKQSGTDVLPWAAKLGLEWVGQDGFNGPQGCNTETMFSKRYTTTDWNRGQQYTNRFVLFTGVRDVAGAPFHQGWGWCTVHPAFVKSWSDDDPRKWGSILDLNDSEQAVSWNPNSGTQVTGYLNKKYQTLAVNGADGVKGLFYYLCGNSGVDMQTWHGQDFIYMRYADVLLMHSELTGDATGLNAVRARAGLEPVAYSLDALKEERLHEFAFEGIRWFDLVRWGDVANGKNFYGSECDVINVGVPGKYSVSYRPEIKGLVSIPESEIALSNGVYEQNPGW